MTTVSAYRSPTFLEPRFQDDLETLLTAPPGPCVSIFLPSKPSGAGDEPARILLKDLLREAEGRLAGISAPTAVSLLAPAQALTTPADLDFWRHQQEGLALFLAPGVFRPVSLPYPVKARVETGDHFVIRPLLPLLRGGAFHVLALSRNEVRLVEVRGRDFRRLDLPGVPHNLVDALGDRMTIRILQYHTASAPSSGARPAQYHGTGLGGEDEKAELERYLRRVDAALAARLPDRDLPLVLAGVEYLLAIFRSLTSLPAVAAEGVPGNPEAFTDAELVRRARMLAEPFFAEARRRAAVRFEELEGSGRASLHITEVLPAAREGRVAVLFLSTAADLRGTFTDGRVLPGGDDLLDLAAAWTLSYGGAVHAVPPGEMPEEADVAAIFRYSGPEAL